MSQGTDILSPDGQFRWDGHSWQPAGGDAPSNFTQPAAVPQLASPTYSDDGRWRWDGVHWVTASPSQPVPAPPAYTAVTPGASATDGKAIASLVLSIVWLLGVGSIVAVVLGHLSRSASRKALRQPSGLALAGLIIGYVGIAGMALGIVLAASIPAMSAHGVNSKASAVKSDLVSGAVGEETFFVDNDTYTSSISDLEAEGFQESVGIQVTVISADENSYCLAGSTVSGSDTYYYSSESNSITTVPCF